MCLCGINSLHLFTHEIACMYVCACVRTLNDTSVMAPLDSVSGKSFKEKSISPTFHYIICLSKYKSVTGTIGACQFPQEHMSCLLLGWGEEVFICIYFFWFFGVCVCVCVCLTPILCPLTGRYSSIISHGKGHNAQNNQLYSKSY